MKGSSCVLDNLLDEVVGPLITQDGGELYVVECSIERLHLHLRGRFSGCAGNPLVIQRVIAPALETVAPGCGLRVSSGELLPEGASRWTAPEGQEGTD